MSVAPIAAAFAALLLASCASNRQPQAGATPPAPPAPGPALDATYDWHVLMTAPFGSLLKEFPGTLHEVLQFRDEARSEPPAGDTECYGLAAAPRFMARVPDEYLLCFTHDRLSRIEATARLRGSEAGELFAGACALWARGAPSARPAPDAPTTQPAPSSRSRPQSPAPSGPVPAATASPAGAADAPTGGACQGRDGAIRYSASLGAVPEENDVLLTIELEPGTPE